MLKVFDFKCDQGHIFEEFVESGTTTSRCGCGANATKVVSSPRFMLDGSTDAFPERT